jgi:DNA-binding transcriptional regulator YiaG
MPCMKHINVRAIRESLGLSQTQMAERLGVNQSTVSKLERGIYAPDGPILKMLEIIKAERADA